MNIVKEGARGLALLSFDEGGDAFFKPGALFYCSPPFFRHPGRQEEIRGRMRRSGTCRRRTRHSIAVNVDQLVPPARLLGQINNRHQELGAFKFLQFNAANVTTPSGKQPSGPLGPLFTPYSIVTIHEVSRFRCLLAPNEDRPRQQRIQQC